MSRYFDNFSITQYNGEMCRTLTQRAAISQDVIKRTSVFYPYQAREGERCDTLAHLYYKDSAMDWLVYFANGVVDPYYEWPLPQEQFDAYMVSKYGSLIISQLKTHHYQVDWVNDDRKLTISAYDALPSVAPINCKQYWNPSLNEYGVTSFYVRKPIDTIVVTNRILQINMNSTTGYVEGELVSQEVNGTVAGYGEIVLIGDMFITIQHVNGSFVASNNVVGFDSQTTQSATAVTVLSENIPVVEQPYWRAISIYEYEESLNEQRKAMKIVDNSFAELAESNLKTLMT